MKIQKAIYAVRMVAKQRGISAEQVIREIDYAIQEAMQQANEPSTSTAWERIPRKGSVPTALELIEYLAEEVKRGEI